MRLKTVVFPAPFGPMRPKMEWCGTLKDTSPTARSPPKFFETFSRTRSDISGLGLGLRRGGLRAALLEQLALAEEPFGAEDHERHEHHRVHDHAERVEIESLDAALQILD